MNRLLDISQKNNLSSNTTGNVSRFQTLPDEMSLQTFEQIRQTIYMLSGIFYTDNKKYLLESNIKKRMKVRNVKTFEEYHNLIKNRNEKEELQSFYDSITINETFFFREENHYEILENKLIPEIINSKSKMTTQTVRIWSAASSTGEEAYTLALIIKEKFMHKYPNINFEIIGTDISSAVIFAAQRGIYRDYSIRNIPKYYLDKYFIKSENLYALKNDIKKIVKFQNMNLYDNYAMNLQRNFDIIFCRNVLIYFDTLSKEKVVKYMYNAMNKNGHFLVGTAETLNNVRNDFKQKIVDKSVVYYKE